MIGSHIECDGVWCIQPDDVTCLEVKHPSSVQSTFASRGEGSLQWLYYGQRSKIVVYTNTDSPSGVIVVNLCVDIVPSRGGHSQVSVVVLHAACQVTAMGTDRPVLYY